MPSCQRMQRLVVRAPPRDPGQQFGEHGGEQFERPAPALSRSWLCAPRRQHERKTRAARTTAPTKNLKDTIDRRIQRIALVHGRHQQHDNGSHCGRVSGSD